MLPKIYDFGEVHSKDWINNANQTEPLDQSEVYEEEKTHMFTYINNFVTDISIEKERLYSSSNYNKILK